ncbi:hypothetical protein JL722_4905 [Aureococcus anophagefferens]|nr:hypothetical protein JL722_4905 [Aureococcus anophagefferens]
MDVTEIRDADAFGWFQAQKCAEAHLRRRDQRERGFQHELQEAMERADALELRMDALCDERHDAAFAALASLVEATVDPGPAPSRPRSSPTRRGPWAPRRSRGASRGATARKSRPSSRP